VSAVLAFYGAGWFVYSQLIARGRDVVFTRDTPMETHFGTHQGPFACPDADAAGPQQRALSAALNGQPQVQNLLSFYQSVDYRVSPALERTSH